MSNISTQDKGASNSQLLETWIDLHFKKDDWTDYIRNGQLNRSQIAAEIGIVRSALYTNEVHASLLGNLETRLRAQGRLPPVGHVTKQDKAASEREERHIAELETRLKSLEERNATLLAENRDIKRKLDRYRMIEDHLSTTGRLLPQ
ncbi:MAG: VPA1267 family protein [Sterolibacterium sp.]